MVMKHHYTTLLTFNDVLRGKIHYEQGATATLSIRDRDPADPPILR